MSELNFLKNISKLITDYLEYDSAHDRYYAILEKADFIKKQEAVFLDKNHTIMAKTNDLLKTNDTIPEESVFKVVYKLIKEKNLPLLEEMDKPDNIEKFIKKVYRSFKSSNPNLIKLCSLKFRSYNHTLSEEDYKDLLKYEAEFGGRWELIMLAKYLNLTIKLNESNGTKLLINPGSEHRIELDCFDGKYAPSKNKIKLTKIIKEESIQPVIVKVEQSPNMLTLYQNKRNEQKEEKKENKKTESKRNSA